MTRINFNHIKAEADFAAVLAHYNITLLGSGDQRRIKCPFHDDKNPSCSVNLADKVFNCKAGSCGANGGVLDFVMQLESCDLRGAAAKVAEICGIETSAGANGSKKPPQKPARRRNASPTTDDTGQGGGGAPGGCEEPEEAKTANAPLDPEFLARYVPSLDTNHPYLPERVGSEAMQAYAPCGYCKTGIMKGRAVLPLRNAGGVVLGFLGRWTGDLGEIPEGEDKYKFPKGYSKTLDLFNLCRVDPDTQWLVLVEGAFSAIRLDQLGFATVAVLGSSVSDAQIALLQERLPRLRLVLVLFDGDEAGRVAAGRAAPALARAFSTRIVDLEEGAEPDTIDAAELKALIDRKRP